MDTTCTLKRVHDAVPIKILVKFHSVGLVEEYIRLLTLKPLCDDFDTLPPSLSPSHPVDEVWHTHMLLPQAYAQTCRALLSGQDAVFKHSSEPRSGPGRYINTMKMYEDIFGIKPNPAAWPDETPSPAPNEIQIFVETYTGKTLSAHLAPKATVADLKMKLQEIWNFPVEEQRLIYLGQHLDDGRTLRDYKIGPQTTLYSVLRFTGC